MTTKTKVNQALQQRAAQAPSRSKKPQTLKDFVNAMQPAIEKALPASMTPDRFTRIVLTAITDNPKLEQCDPKSFCGAMMQAAQLGLEPNTPLGQAYLIPYGNQCQFQLGYNGLITLAYRSGDITKIDAQTVYENDDFEYELGWDAKLKHKPAMENRGKPIGYYATFHTKDDGGNFLFMSYEDVYNHAKKFSKSFNNGPWKNNFDSMAKKTVLKQLLKYAPLNVNFVRQVNTDETFKNVDTPEQAEHVLDAQNAVEYVVEEEIDPQTGEVIDIDKDPNSDAFRELSEELDQMAANES